MNKPIVNTFVLIAPDSSAEKAVVPDGKADKLPIHVIQYQLLTHNPYVYTHETLIYETHIRHKQINNPDKRAIWDNLFQKGQACMRASALPKKYGWGVHYNEEGKIALYAVESAEYKAFANDKSGNLAIVYAMRTQRAKT